jgi:hypothetical protein
MRESLGGAFESRGKFFIRVTVGPRQRHAEHAPLATGLDSAKTRTRVVQAWVSPKYVFPVVEDKPIADVTLEDYERVMRETRAGACKLRSAPTGMSRK